MSNLIYKNEKGMVLPLGLMFLAIIAILGSTAVIVTTTDLKIGSNYRDSEQAFYAAEAGIQEALYRLGLFNQTVHPDTSSPTPPPSGSYININGLVNNNAHISIDPHNLLGNGTDDDGDTVVDEMDELNYNGGTGSDNRNWKTKIMLATSESGFTDTYETIYTTTIQPSASWLEYSSSTDDGTVLTIEYKKDANDMDGDSNTDEIVFYNADLTNPYNVQGLGGADASGQPIVVITSTGRSNGSIKKIQVEATYQIIDVQAEAAVMVNMLPTFNGNVVVSGFNYDGSVSQTDNCLPGCPDISMFEANGADNHGGQESIDELPEPGDCVGCAGYTAGKINNADADINFLECSDVDSGTCGPSDNKEEKYSETEIPYGSKLEASGHKPGVWSTAAGIDPTTADVWGGNVAGTTSWKDDTVPAGAWMTLAEIIGLTQDQVDAMLASANVTEADMHASSGKLQTAPQGVIYIDNNDAGDNELDIAAGTPSVDDGWGLMYVTGDVKISSGAFQFKGLIYVEGDIKASGSPLFVGCVAVKGAVDGAFSSGTPHIIYSYDALTQYANKGMKFVVLSWKEVLN